MTVANKIREIRKEKRLTQKQLGDLCGIAESTIRRYELGLLNPKIETIQKIANSLQVDISELYTDFTIFKNYITEDSPALSAAQRLGLLENDLFKDLKQRRIVEELDITEDKQELLFEYNKLNTDGQKEARKRVEELTEIPRYTKSDKSAKYGSKIKAAHNDYGADLEEQRKMREDISILKRSNSTDE